MKDTDAEAERAISEAERCASRVKDHRCRLPSGHAGFHQSRTPDGKTFSWDSPESRD